MANSDSTRLNVKREGDHAIMTIEFHLTPEKAKQIVTLLQDATSTAMQGSPRRKWLRLETSIPESQQES